MFVSSLCRIVARVLTWAANQIDQIETVEIGPRLVSYPSVRVVSRPAQTFQPAVPADMDAIEAECERLVRRLDDETNPGYLN